MELDAAPERERVEEPVVTDLVSIDEHRPWVELGVLGEEPLEDVARDVRRHRGRREHRVGDRRRLTDHGNLDDAAALVGDFLRGARSGLRVFGTLRRAPGPTLTSRVPRGGGGVLRDRLLTTA